MSAAGGATSSEQWTIRKFNSPTVGGLWENALPLRKQTPNEEKGRIGDRIHNQAQQRVVSSGPG